MKPDPAVPASMTKALKVLDLSYNPLTANAVQHISDMLDVNRNLEYLGLAKCHLSS
jgi:Ran GTPase-activating protein (RanGAP) involved in mRNA processing and transport